MSLKNHTLQSLWLFLKCCRGIWMSDLITGLLVFSLFHVCPHGLIILQIMELGFLSSLCQEESKKSWDGHWEHWLWLIVDRSASKKGLLKKKKKSSKRRIQKFGGLFYCMRINRFMCAYMHPLIQFRDSETITARLLTLVVFTLFPEMHDQPVRSGRTLHSSPSRHGSILHHHFWRTMEAGEKHTTEQGHFRQRAT